MSSRAVTYELLNATPTSSGAARAIGATTVVLILISVIAGTLETVPALRHQYAPLFAVIELTALLLFSVEYGLRVWSAPEDPIQPGRWRFLRSPGSIIDLLAILPPAIGYLLGVNLSASIVLRLLRLLRLVRYFEPLGVLAKVIASEFRAFMSAMFVLAIVVLIAATGIYFFERQAQPEIFGSIPESMWWAIVTLTTLGYGDSVPITVPGRIFAALITILAVGSVALPAGMLASRFSDELRKRKNAVGERIASHLTDGRLSAKERAEIADFGKQQCLSDDDMEELMRAREHGRTCPTCGKRS